MMDMKKMSQQMMDVYKNAFDNSYDALMMYQEQLQRWNTMLWGQMVTLPEEAKKNLTEWAAVCKKNGAEFKKVVDDNFKTMEAFTA